MTLAAGEIQGGDAIAIITRGQYLSCLLNLVMEIGFLKDGQIEAAKK